jgi:uncharacterized repeat protein (TIGR03803 family)
MSRAASVQASAGVQSGIGSFTTFLVATTFQGGSLLCGGRGCGTLFSYNKTARKMTVLHAFAGPKDGQAPFITQPFALATGGYQILGAAQRGGTKDLGTLFGADVPKLYTRDGVVFEDQRGECTVETVCDPIGISRTRKLSNLIFVLDGVTTTTNGSATEFVVLAF